MENLFRKLRQESGLSQADFATRTGIGYSTVQAAESGKHVNRATWKKLWDFAVAAGRQDIADQIDLPPALKTPSSPVIPPASLESLLIEFTKELSQLRQELASKRSSDLASLEGYEVKRVFYPGEKIISQHPVSSGRYDWIELLREILDSGQNDAISAVTQNILLFVQTVRLRAPKVISTKKRAK